MLYLTCIMISSIELAHYGVPRAKDWVSVDCGTRASLLFRCSREVGALFDRIFRLYIAWIGQMSHFATDPS